MEPAASREHRIGGQADGFALGKAGRDRRDAVRIHRAAVGRDHHHASR